MRELHCRRYFKWVMVDPGNLEKKTRKVAAIDHWSACQWPRNVQNRTKIAGLQGETNTPQLML